MFICQLGNHVTLPRERAIHVVLETRLVANGETQIVKEILACEPCSKGEARPPVPSEVIECPVIKQTAKDRAYLRKFFKVQTPVKPKMKTTKVVIKAPKRTVKLVSKKKPVKKSVKTKSIKHVTKKAVVKKSVKRPVKK